MTLSAFTQIITRHNSELAGIFHRMASCYRYLGNEHRFRVLAYDGAARTLQSLKEDISIYAKDIDTLDKLNGIGESIARKIMEYLQTGKIKTFEKLKSQVPQDLLDLMDLKSFGPATLKTLHEKLAINNKKEIITAIQAGRIEGLKGFGPQRIENMKRGLKLYKDSTPRMLLWNALQLGNEILKEILKMPHVKTAILAGSLRRKKETIGDIDIVATADKKDWKKIVNKFLVLKQADRVIAGGETRASILLKKAKMQVDLRLVHEYEYGSAILYFTGSREHTIALRSLAKNKGWKLNEYGLFDIETGKRLAGATEEEIFQLLGMQTIPPELREDRGEIERAKKYSLPKLVEVRDIKGDMQMRSTWSDGTENIETIANYILHQFPHYEYIVITDHPAGNQVAGGLQPAGFIRQFEEIDIINRKLGRNFIKKGVEADILTDGSLDLPDDLLQQFDWVTASIHSGFNKDNTERLIRACDNPYVHCIGHPSGRLIGKREAYTVDWKKLIEKAALTGTALEINAQPNRLDLNDELVKATIGKGIKLTISADSHALDHYNFMAMGVAVARRGWCSKENILNTLSWNEIELFKHYKNKLVDFYPVSQ